MGLRPSRARVKRRRVPAPIRAVSPVFRAFSADLESSRRAMRLCRPAALQAVLNLLHIGAAFAVQYAIGLLVKPTVGEGANPSAGNFFGVESQEPEFRLNVRVVLAHDFPFRTELDKRHHASTIQITGGGLRPMFRHRYLALGSIRS